MSSDGGRLGADPRLGFPDHVKLGTDEVIVVTGGSGFLGQHIVRILQERTDGIKEIRVVDIVPFVKKLTYVDKYPVKFYLTDITIEDQLDRPFKGATGVVHSAAVVDVGHYVDRTRMRSVNMIGTTNVVMKCRQWNIEKLVLTSSVDAVIQKGSAFVNQAEGQTVLPLKEDKFLMGYYAFTKAQSEAIVMCTRNKPMANGKILKTAILRPTVMYGELDPYFVPGTLKLAKMAWGYLPQPAIFQGEPVLQCTYVGNAAWAHALALWKLHEEIKSETEPEEWREVDGQEIYITDDTHPTVLYEFMKPYLALKGFSLLQVPIPLTFVLFSVYFMSTIMKSFPDSWKKWLQNHPFFPTYESFRMAHSAVHVSRLKSTNCLQYSPLYSEEKARSLSEEYYRDCKI